MLFETTFHCQDHYLYWDAEQELLLPVSEKKQATPIETINAKIVSLLSKPEFTSNIQVFTGIPTKVNVTCLTYLQCANAFLKRHDATGHPLLPNIKSIVHMISEALKSSENSKSNIEKICFQENEDSVKELLKGLSCEKIDYLADVAVEHVIYPVLKIVLEHLSREKLDSLLQDSFKNNQTDLILILLNFMGEEAYKKSLCIAIEQLSSIEVINLTLEKGASVHERNDQGWPLLCMAVMATRQDIVECLLKTDIDVNATTPKGSSALHFAAMIGDAGIVKLLLQAKANPDLKDELGYTYLDWVINSGFIEENFKL